MTASQWQGAEGQAVQSADPANRGPPRPVLKPPRAVEPEWLNSMDNFAAALRDGTELASSGRDGRRTQAILDAMYRSAYEADGGWVDVEPEMS